MILAALVLAATFPYQSLLSQYDKPVFQAGESRYEFYTDADLGDGRKVVVYGFTPVRRGSDSDIEHQVFVTIVAHKGNGYEIASARRDVTDKVFNMGERGRFVELRARVNLFQLRGGQFVDVSLWSTISGTGAISSANDVIFRISTDGQLINAATLEVTQEFSRNGWREVRETSSELAVAEDGLVWTRKERLASRNKAEEPFRVNCQTTQTTYRRQGHNLVASPTAPKGKARPLGRVPMKEIVPCCSGCELKE